MESCQLKDYEECITNGLLRSMKYYLFIKNLIRETKKNKDYDLDMLPRKWYFKQAAKEFKYKEQTLYKNCNEFEKLMNEKTSNHEVYDYVNFMIDKNKAKNMREELYPTLSFEEAAKHFNIVDVLLVKKKYFFHKKGFYDLTVSDHLYHGGE